MKTRAGTDGDTPLAGRIDTLRSIGFDQRQHTQTGPEPLLGVRAVRHHHLAECGHGRAGPCRLRQHSGRGPFAEAAMRRRHMIGHSHMVAPTGRTDMARNPLTTMEYFDCLASYANINLLFDQGERDGIPGAVDFDVVIGCHAGTLPAGEDIGIGRQRLQIGSVQRCEQIGTAGAIATHHAHVQLVQKPPDRDVQLRQREETSTFALLRGLRGRAGKIAVP